MNKQSAKYSATISFVMAWLVVPLPTQSCGPDLAVDATRFALFRPETEEDPGLIDFNYTHHFLYGGNSNDNMRNCGEWQAFTNNRASVSDIYIIQYETDPDDFIYAYNNNNWEDFKENSFVQWLTKKENRAALDYLAMAKKIEFNQLDYNNNPWGDTTTTTHEEVIGELDIQDILATPLPEFLRNRYTFQLLKLMYFVHHPGKWQYQPELIQIYEKQLMGKQTIVADWAMLYYALSQPTRQLRDLYMVRTFDRSDEKKHYVYQWLSYEQLDTLGKTLTDKHDRFVAKAMKLMMTPSRAMDKVKELYSEDPESRYIPLLITREVNKLEDWIWSPEILKFQPQLQVDAFWKSPHSAKHNGIATDTTYLYYLQKNIQKDKAYARDLNEWLQQLPVKGTISKDFLNLCIAHLYCLDSNYQAAGQWLAKVNDKQPRYRKQALIEKIIITANTADITTPSAKQELLGYVDGLAKLGIYLKEQGTEEYYDQPEEPDDDLNELLVLLSRRYQKAGDVVTAGLLLQRAAITINEYTGYGKDSVSYSRISYLDKYGKPADIDTLFALKYKKNKTPFEKYITAGLNVSDQFLLDLKGTMLVREQKFNEALLVFNKIDDSFWMKNYEYRNYLPATNVASVGTLLPVPGGPQVKYPYKSKKLIVKDIVQLQERVRDAKDNETKAQLSFQLANAYFNITRGGKAWMLYSYGKSSHEYWPNEAWVYYDFRSPDIQKMKTYFAASEAMDTYRKTIALTKNKELIAQCLLMLGYCDLHSGLESPFNGIHYYDGNIHEYKSRYLKLLAKKYDETELFNKAISTCPDIAYYY